MSKQMTPEELRQIYNAGTAKTTAPAATTDTKASTTSAGTTTSPAKLGNTSGLINNVVNAAPGIGQAARAAGLGNDLGYTTYTTNTNNQPYIDQLNALYDQVMNRKPFQYDLNGDLLYQQMADQYTRLGQQAMMDTMGQAAALTGGYGNSYASAVGNQAYQQYMTGLTDQLPALYQQAYNVYQGDTDRLLQQYDLAAQHPGVVNSLSPQTYVQYNTSGIADGNSSSDGTSEFAAALAKALLVGSGSNDLANWYNKQTKK